MSGKTAFVESTVNQVISKPMVKKQQMRWTPRGAHLLCDHNHGVPVLGVVQSGPVADAGR